MTAIKAVYLRKYSQNDISPFTIVSIPQGQGGNFEQYGENNIHIVMSLCKYFLAFSFVYASVLNFKIQS